MKMNLKAKGKLTHSSSVTAVNSGYHFTCLFASGVHQRAMSGHRGGGSRPPSPEPNAHSQAGNEAGEVVESSAGLLQKAEDLQNDEGIELKDLASKGTIEIDGRIVLDEDSDEEEDENGENKRTGGKRPGLSDILLSEAHRKAMKDYLNHWIAEMLILGIILVNVVLMCMTMEIFYFDLFICIFFT